MTVITDVQRVLKTSQFAFDLPAIGREAIELGNVLGGADPNLASESNRALALNRFRTALKPPLVGLRDEFVSAAYSVRAVLSTPAGLLGARIFRCGGFRARSFRRHAGGFEDSRKSLDLLEQRHQPFRPWVQVA